MLQSLAAFKENATSAIGNAGLQRALARAKPHFAQKRQAAIDLLPEFEALRGAAANIKNHTIANLDFYLETYAAAVEASGGTVHWCSTAQDARQATLKICQNAGAKTVTKGKSMVTEEISLNPFLEANGITPVETDLGEYILQLRGETPSHIIAPAFHLNREDWEESFRKSHTDLPADRVFRERRDLLTEAPVSYTHLDVYKRQHAASPAPCRHTPAASSSAPKIAPTRPPRPPAPPRHAPPPKAPS